MKRVFAVLLIFAALAAAAWGLWVVQFGGDDAPVVPTADDIARAESLRPAGPALAAIYERSCVSCHALVDAQAPLAGHRAAWAPRVAEKGLDGLVMSVRHGVGAMPPSGLCADCTDAEYRALITFMADLEDAQ